jgi:hypothetical protein
MEAHIDKIQKDNELLWGDGDLLRTLQSKGVIDSDGNPIIDVSNSR